MLQIIPCFCHVKYTLFSKQHFHKQHRNTKLKLAKNQAKAKQPPEAELLLFENYSLSSSMLSSKTNLRYSKKCAKNICVSVLTRLYD